MLLLFSLTTRSSNSNRVGADLAGRRARAGGLAFYNNTRRHPQPTLGGGGEEAGELDPANATFAIIVVCG
eukprot:2932004-Heterocapsa_arctica.AAC.1